MKWPWQRSEKRQGGGYTDAIVSALEAAAASGVANVGASAAIEAASGALSRAFMAAEVDAPSWAQDVINPPWLAQVGRSLIREGASLSVIAMDGSGAVELVPASYWTFEGGGEYEEGWQCRASTYGPSSSHERLLGRDRLVYVRWGTSPGTRYRGQGPMSWASLTAKTASESERSLGDEASGPVAQLLSIPQDGGDGGDDDPLKDLKSGIHAARGKVLLVETTASGWGEGMSAAPRKDWTQERLGPQPPAAAVQVARDSFDRMLAACGIAPALFNDADGTSQREALRRFHLNTVGPLARLLEHELSKRLDAPIKLKFDKYNVDLAGRAMSFKKLVEGGMDVSKALALTGLLVED